MSESLAWFPVYNMNATDVHAFTLLRSELALQNWPWLVLAALAACLFYTNCKSFLQKSRGPLPPGPRPWPVVGNIPNLVAGGPLPYETLATLANQYGPVMSIWLGSKLSVIISSPEAAKEVLRDFDQACSSRPVVEVMRIFSYGLRDIAFVPTGPYHKHLRKLCATYLFTKRRLAHLQPVRMNEVQRMCGAVKEEAGIRGGVVSVRPLLATTTMNNIMRMSIGKSSEYSLPGKPNLDADDFIAQIQEGMEVMGAFNIADHLPFLQPFDPAGVVKRAKQITTKMHNFLSDAVVEHERQLAAAKSDGAAPVEPRDFCDALLLADEDERLDTTGIVALLQDMLFAGTDTSAGVTEWALLELIRHPDKRARLQKEVDGVLGKAQAGKGPGENDDVEARLMELPYLKGVVKETLRLHIVGPMLIPHFTTSEVVLGNGKYHVPANTMIQVNAWAVTHDPSIWPSPLEFRPERFLDEDIDYKGSDFRYLPFGSGRRGCPGISLGSAMVFLMLAHLVHEFDWQPIPGTTYDVMAKFGLSVAPLTALQAIATSRH